MVAESGSYKGLSITKVTELMMIRVIITPSKIFEGDSFAAFVCRFTITVLLGEKPGFGSSPVLPFFLRLVLRGVIY
jgi:hypothetical protein